MCVLYMMYVEGVNRQRSFLSEEKISRLTILVLPDNIRSALRSAAGSTTPGLVPHYMIWKVQTRHFHFVYPGDACYSGIGSQKCECYRNYAENLRKPSIPFDFKTG